MSHEHSTRIGRRTSRNDVRQRFVIRIPQSYSDDEVGSTGKRLSQLLLAFLRELGATEDTEENEAMRFRWICPGNKTVLPICVQLQRMTAWINQPSDHRTQAQNRTVMGTVHHEQTALSKNLQSPESVSPRASEIETSCPCLFHKSYILGKSNHCRSRSRSCHMCKFVCDKRCYTTGNIARADSTQQVQV